jgi:glycine hydroxymethyltransferase
MLPNQASRIRRLVEEHHKWRSECINLIASENVQSHLVREFMASDFQHRYANYDKENPAKRKYAGGKYERDIDLLTISIAKSLFHAKFVELRAVSGQIADLAVINSLAQKGPVLEVSSKNGGHAAAQRYMTSSVASVKVHELPFDAKTYNIDLEPAKKVIRDLRPELIILGSEKFLFPHPVSEIAQTAEDCQAVVAYDASHVFGLIAGGEFQDPFKEKAHLMMGSTHKTLGGPQGGLILGREDNELGERIKSSLHPSLITNHHPHRIPGLAMSLLEMKQFGKSYARQIIMNSAALGENLYRMGVNCLFPDLGFTRSHTLLVKVPNAIKAQESLEQSNIIVSYTQLPDDKETVTGIRIGVQEITRLGMRLEQMEQVASFISDILIKKKPPATIRREVEQMTRKFRTLHYCFDEGAYAYEYFHLSNLKA